MFRETGTRGRCTNGRIGQICTICDKAVKGDEIHFTFECDRLRDIRQKYIPTSFTDSNSNKHAFVKLLQSNDVGLLITFSKFIHLGLREYGHVYR